MPESLRRPTARARRVLRFVAPALVATAMAGALPARAMDDPIGPPYPVTEFPEGAKTASVSAGGVTATITMEMRPAVDIDEVPVLRVTVGGQQVLEAVGVASGFGFPETQAGIVEIDPTNLLPEVYFTSYSGGAHCCTRVIVASATSAGWVATELGTFDGGPDYLEDADGDGAMELVTIDNRFLYTFDCYACSAGPLVIQTVRGGVGADVSNEPGFQEAHRDWLRQLDENEDRDSRWTSQGFLAGWVASRARVGEGAAGFRELTEHWNLAADEGEDWCLDNVEIFDDCPLSRRAVLKFPERLKLFLEWTGYPI